MFRRAFYAPLYYTMLFLYNIMAVQPAPFRLIQGCSNTAFKPPALPILPLIIRLYTCTYPLFRCCIACYVRLKLCCKRVFIVILHCYYNVKFWRSITLCKHSVACCTVNSDSAMMFHVKLFLYEFAPESRWLFKVVCKRESLTHFVTKLPQYNMQNLYQLTLMNNSDSQRLSLANDFEKSATLWRKFI